MAAYVVSKRDCQGISEYSLYNLHCILTSIGKKKRTVNFEMIMEFSLAPVKTQTSAGNLTYCIILNKLVDYFLP